MDDNDDYEDIINLDQEDFLLKWINHHLKNSDHN